MKLGTILILYLVLVSSPDALAKDSAAKLLEKAEFIRNPQKDYTVSVELIDKSKKGESVRTFKTLVKGRERALVKFVKPEADTGKQVLMVDGNMWAFMPKTAKPIRVSPKQRLAGNAAYGDIARLNFVGNYDAKIAATASNNQVILNLVARSGKLVTYPKIRYHIDQKTGQPKLVEFQTAGGKTMKTATFHAYQNVLGVQRPTQMLIKDSLNKSKVTELNFKNAKQRSLPDIMFEKQSLGRS